jgi:hypothetical protein
MKCLGIVLVGMLFSGCLFKYEYFVHQPTDQYRARMRAKAFPEASEYIWDGILFIPDVTEVNTAGAGGRPYIKMYSHQETKVVVDKVELAKGEEEPLVIDVRKAVDVSVSSVSRGLFYGSLLLNLGEPSLRQAINSALFECIKNESLTITIHLRNTEGNTKVMTFDMTLRHSTDIACPT